MTIQTIEELKPLWNDLLKTLITPGSKIPKNIAHKAEEIKCIWATCDIKNPKHMMINSLRIMQDLNYISPELKSQLKETETLFQVGE